MQNDFVMAEENTMPVDFDGDGKLDALAVDIDNDGYVEAIVVPHDADGNGIPEQIDVYNDVDYNGSYETKLQVDDFDQDGIADKTTLYTNGDDAGEYTKEGVLFDMDGDGIPDNLLPDPDEPGFLEFYDANGCLGSKRDSLIKEINDTKDKIAYEQKEIARITGDIANGWIGQETSLTCLENGLESNQSKLRDLERELANLKE